MAMFQGLVLMMMWSCACGGMLLAACEMLTAEEEGLELEMRVSA